MGLRTLVLLALLIGTPARAEEFSATATTPHAYFIDGPAFLNMTLGDGRSVTIALSGPKAGEVTLPPRLSISKASRHFWRVLKRAHYDVCHGRED